MAEVKIGDLPALGASPDVADLFEVKDVSATASKKVTWLELVPAATASVAGKVELATDAETLTGTDTARATTPANVKAVYPQKAAFPCVLGPFIFGADDTLVANGDTLTFRLPHAMTLTLVRAHVLSPSADPIELDVTEAATTVFSTTPTIDGGETSTSTAGTPAVISDAALADNALIAITVVDEGDGLAEGLRVWLLGTRVIA